MVKETQTGASLVAGIQLQFAADVDTSAWPSDPKATVEPSSPFLLVAAPADGAPVGSQLPLRWRYHAQAGTYHELRTLRVVPDWGFALVPATRYVFAIRSGAGVERSPEMQQLLSGCKPNGELGERALSVVTDAMARLTEIGYSADDFAYVQVFTTDDPASRRADPFRSARAHADSEAA